MTVKTKELLSEMAEALYQKKAVLLTGNTGVGKTYLAKKISEQLSKNEYSCFPASKDQTVNVEIISCHNSVTYEDVVGGITAGTESDKIVFEYKDKNGMDRTNLSFFSARMYIEYSYKIELRVGKDVYVEGIPKGYVDKNGHRQNYIHILKINDLEVNKEPPLYGDGYWNGKK